MITLRKCLKGSRACQGRSNQDYILPSTCDATAFQVQTSGGKISPYDEKQHLREEKKLLVLTVRA